MGSCRTAISGLHASPSKAEFAWSGTARPPRPKAASSLSIPQPHNWFPSARIFVNAINGFVQDSYKWSSRVTLEGGVRVEWNGTPTEAEGRFVAFDPTTTQLAHVGSGSYRSLYSQNWHVEPRIGFIIDPRSEEHTSELQSLRHLVCRL